MPRTIWTVYTANDQELTVLAEADTEATDLAMEFCGDTDGDRGAYPVHPSTESPTFCRWVGFCSLPQAESQIREFDSAGVTVDQLWIREWARPGVGPLLWEIGAKDADWCRLPPGVLCGGDE